MVAFVIIIIAFMSIVMAILMSRDSSETKSHIRKSLKENLQEKMLTEPDYTPTQQLFNGEILISFDETQEKLLITNLEQNEIINFRDVISCEIVRDDITVTKTARGSQIGGAIIGGALAGGIGAVIGGLSSKQTQSTEVRKIDLRIVVDSLSNPIRDIPFYRSNKYVVGDEFTLNPSIQNVEKWYSLLSIIIRRNEKKEFESRNIIV